MGKSLVFDYAALAIYIILLVSYFGRTKRVMRLDRIFINLLVVCTLAVSFDIGAVLFDLQGDGNRAWKYAFHIAYLAFRILILVVYSLYISYVTDIRHKTFKYPAFQFAFSLVYLFNFVLIVTAPLNGYMFYIDERDIYVRGPLFMVLYGTVVFYAVFTMTWIFIAGKQIGTKKVVSLCSMIGFMVVAAVIQLFYPNYLVEMGATSLSIIFLLEEVQRPDTRIDMETYLYNEQAYQQDMRLAFFMKKPIKVVMMNITNYDQLVSVLGHERVTEVMRRVGEMGITQMTNLGLRGEIYYRGRGKYRIVAGEKYYSEAEKIADIFNEIFQQELVTGDMSVSFESLICISDCPEDFSSFEELMNFGHTLNSKVYTSTVIYAREFLKGKDRVLQGKIDYVIENALQNHKFEVYYQPIYDVKNNRYNSAEALLRLIDDEYGFVSPEIFIPAAEKSGAIHRIGAYVMDEVCAFIASEEYKASGMDYIEVNLSVTQCMQKELWKNTLSIMEHYGVKPEQINLEITETAASYSQDTLTENIEKLTEEGITFSLDDYGTGYSNMNRIATMPLHIIKLDKSFTNAKTSNRMDIILRDTISMIKDLDIKIVAEGLETTDMVEKYSLLGCDYIQGYYFSKPLPKDKFLAFLGDAKVELAKLEKKILEQKKASK